MAKTLANLNLSLAYRLGENSAPSDANETARRKSFINEAYRDIMRRHYWWFSEETTTFNSVANQASYATADGVPTDLRAVLELRFQDKVYRQITQVDAMGALTIPYNNASQSYFLFDGKIYPVPPFSSSVVNGIALKYYKNPTELSATSDSIIIPDIFSDVLVTYAYARVMQIKGKRGSASDGFEEHKEILSNMVEEQNKYLFSLKEANGESEITGSYE